MKILFLADMQTPDDDNNIRFALEKFLIKGVDKLSSAMMAVPHGPLLAPVLLATILKNAGYNDIEIMECAFRMKLWPKLIEKLQAQPDIICISTTFLTRNDQMEFWINRLIRGYSPNSKIILGGPTLNLNLEMRKMADYCVVGEGENVIVPLVQAIEDGVEGIAIPGVYVFKDGVHEGRPAPLVTDMDQIPFPDWSLVERNKNEFFMLATQRGCLWRCTFCDYPKSEGFKMRYRSIENIIEEIIINKEKYGIWRYLFADATFSAPTERCKKLLEAIIALPFKIEWSAYARVDNITPELADVMARSGCASLFFGIESGDPDILRKMKKQFSVEDIRTGIYLTKKAGIRCTASWIIGFPGETEESIRNTELLMHELQCENNNICTFNLKGNSPAGMKPKLFEVEGEHSIWRHRTMCSDAAREWTQKICKGLIEKNMRMGSHFDLLHLASVDLGIDDIADLFSLSGQLIQGQLEGSSIQVDQVEIIDKQLTLKSEYIVRSSLKHPIFSN